MPAIRGAAPIPKGKLLPDFLHRPDAAVIQPEDSTEASKNDHKTIEPDSTYSLVIRESHHESPVAIYHRDLNSHSPITPFHALLSVYSTVNPLINTYRSPRGYGSV